MKLRDCFKLLLICLSVLWFHPHSVVGGGAPPECPASLNSNQRSLVDSCCYSPLLSSTYFVAVDSDGNGETWTSAFIGQLTCAETLTVCNSSDDWIVTQYINTTLDIASTRVTELPVTISCTGNCSMLDLWFYQTNNANLNRTTVDLPSTFTRVGSVSSMLTVSGLTMDGLYLAVRAQDDACATINRLNVVVTVCFEETLNLETFPASAASSTPVSGSCVANSESSSGEAPTATCGSNGRWSIISSCVCSAGHTLQAEVCVECPAGTYKDTAGNEACTSCPANSVAGGTGNTMCACEGNHTRPTPTRVSDGCTECVSNFFTVGGRCAMCPMNSESSGGSAASCSCTDGHTTPSGSDTTTSDDCVCQANNYVNGNDQCVSCPVNSVRAIDADPSSCTCSDNFRTPAGDATTSGVDCTGCVEGYFVTGSMCMMCPANSESADPVSTDCMCSGSTVTAGEMSTTTGAECSSCPANWRSSSNTPLVCEPCPERSQRPFGDQLDTCTCYTGYEYGNSDVCLVRVIIPGSTLSLTEGSAAEPASFQLALSNDSYNELNVRILVDDAFQSRVSPNTNVMFNVGEKLARVEIAGNDEALDGDQTFQIEVLANDDYAGHGMIHIRLQDDDVVRVGFLSSQSVVFNESDRTASITLYKNATTAQDIQVNIVISPEDSSVSVTNPVTLDLGAPGNTVVPLTISDDVSGDEGDESISFRLELVSPSQFTNLIELTGAGGGVSDELTIVIRDDDPPRQKQVLDLYAIIGIAVGGVAVIVLLVLIVLVCVCICRFNANRRGFYFTDEDKTTAPPSMLRYSASLRSISSQSVVPIVSGKGPVAEKENEFYV